jgi:hypothetical protein
MERTLVTSAENDAPNCLLDIIEWRGIGIVVDPREKNGWEDTNRDIHYSN